MVFIQFTLAKAFPPPNWWWWRCCCCRSSVKWDFHRSILLSRNWIRKWRIDVGRRRRNGKIVLSLAYCKIFSLSIMRNPVRWKFCSFWYCFNDDDLLLFAEIKKLSEILCYRFFMRWVCKEQFGKTLNKLDEHESFKGGLWSAREKFVESAKYCISKYTNS